MESIDKATSRVLIEKTDIEHKKSVTRKIMKAYKLTKQTSKVTQDSIPEIKLPNLQSPRKLKKQMTRLFSP